jgi:lysophospholipase L1-like esterase
VKITRPLALLCIALIPTALVLALCELVAWGVYRYSLKYSLNFEVARRFEGRPALFEPRVIDGKPVLYAPHFPTRYYVEDGDVRGAVISATKTDKTYRVFSLGESSTAGSPFGHWASFSRFVDDALKKIAKRGTNVEVVNLGVSGFGSSRILELTREALTYSPDLLIVYAGHNEHCDTYPLLEALNVRSRQSTLSNMFQDVISSSYALSLGQYLLQQHERLEIPEEPFMATACKEKQKLRATKDGLQLLESVYRTNMQEIARLATLHNTQVLFLSQFSNNLVAPEIFPYPHAEATLRELTAHAWAEKKFGDLGQLLSRFEKEAPENPHYHFYAGLLALHLNDFVDANTQFDAAIERDESARRFRPPYSEILRGIAQSAPGLYFADAAECVRTIVPDGIIDGRLVIDVVHPTVTGQAALANCILSKFFGAVKPRSDLFDYDSLRPERVWETHLETDRYPYICRRFFNLNGWEACISKMKEEFASARTEQERRLASRLWEALYFKGITDRDAELIHAADKIYHSPWRLSLEIPGAD